MSKSNSKTGPAAPRPTSVPPGGAGQGRGPGNAGGWPSTVPNAPSGDKRSFNPPSNQT